MTIFEVRKTVEARKKLAILAHELGYTFDELAAVEGAKRKRAPPTTIYKNSKSPTITWSCKSHKPALPPFLLVGGNLGIMHPHNNLRMILPSNVRQVYLKFITIGDSGLALSRATKLINLEPNSHSTNCRSSLAISVAGAASIGRSYSRPCLLRRGDSVRFWTDLTLGALQACGGKFAGNASIEYDCNKVNRALTILRVTQPQEDF